MAEDKPGSRGVKGVETPEAIADANPGLDIVYKLDFFPNWLELPTKFPNSYTLSPSISSSSISVALINIYLNKFLSSVENMKKLGILFLFNKSFMVSRAVLRMFVFSAKIDCVN